MYTQMLGDNGEGNSTAQPGAAGEADEAGRAFFMIYIDMCIYIYIYIYIYI